MCFELMQADDLAISIRNVSKAYRIWERPAGRLSAPLLDRAASLLPSESRLAMSLQRRAASSYRDFWALKDLSFDVKRGQAVGIVGRNGSGKSTLLQIIAGTLQPTEGSVHVRGRVAALLELGSGFNPEFSGRENVYLNGAVLGLGRKYIDERFEAIAAFAEIGDFIEQPVKTYSSGMTVRLAFAVAAHVDAEVLIIDEALGVGDARFQLKCARAIDRFLTDGVTLLFVSHDPSSVKRLCSQAILLEQGHLVYAGLPNDVINLYSKLLADGGSLEAIQTDIDNLRTKATLVPAYAKGATNDKPLARPPRASTGRTLPLEVSGGDAEKEDLRLRIKALEVLLGSHELGATMHHKYQALLRDERSHVGVSGNEFSYGGVLGRIHSLDVQDAEGQSRTWFTSGEEIAVRMTVEAMDHLAEPIFALT